MPGHTTESVRRDIGPFSLTVESERGEEPHFGGVMLTDVVEGLDMNIGTLLVWRDYSFPAYIHGVRGSNLFCQFHSRVNDK